jgi:integrase
MLTERDIRDLPTTDRVRYIADGRTGLRLRCYPTGAKVWVRRQTIAGVTREEVIGPWPQIPAAEARRRAGSLQPPAPAAPVTFKAAAEQWHRDRIAPRYRASAPIVWRYLERDCAGLMSLRLDKVTRAHLLAAIERKKADGHNAASKLVRILRRFFGYAVAHELIAADPMAALAWRDLEVERPEPRDRLATDDELRAVWNMPAPHGPMLRFVLLTACRVGEARGATAEQAAAGVWTIPTTKSGKPHRLPLSKTAEKLLHAGWEVRSPEALYQRMHKTVAGLNPHDLRRTAATRMRMLGTSSDAIEAILNHAPPRLQRTYQLPDLLPAMREALTQWERELLRVVRKM